MYYSDELYHHGIKGQRWGRRNGPPYPLSAQTHAAVVRSAGRGKVGGLKEDLYNTERKKARNRNIASGVLAADAAIGIVRTPKAIRQTYEMTKGVFGPERAKKAALASGLLNAGLIGAEGLAAYKLRKSAKKHAATAEQISKSKIKGRVGGYDEDKAARRRKIARNIAIGAGAAAALGGAGYLAYKKLRRGGYQQPLLKDNTNGLRLTANRPALTGPSVGGKYSGLGKAKMRNGKRVSSLITPEVGSGRKFKFSTRSSSTALAVPNRNTQLGFLGEEPRRLNWKRVAAAAGGATGLAGGTAYGVSRYRKRKRSRR